MRIAVIDLGTNTFHILIAEQLDTGYNIIHKEKVPVKIGEGGIEERKITEQAINRALNTTRYFATLIKKHNVQAVKCIATSAFRNAINGTDLSDLIRSENGIEVNIINGLDEAKLVYEGVKRAVKLGTEKSLIVDIGGGSVEVIIADSEKEYWLNSFEIGAQRLLDRFHKADPITIDEIISINTYFENQFTRLDEAVSEYKPAYLVGSSGTFDTLIDINYAEKGLEKPRSQIEYELSKSDFNRIYDELISKNREERLEIPGMIEMRVDMIVVAVQLIRFLMDRYQFDAIKISSYALKEGLLYSELYNKKSGI